MPVQILCPNPKCGASYSVVDENLGKLGRCKKCGTKFPLVPQPKDGGPPSSSETDLDSISAPKPADPSLPESFGRYKIVRLLGRGGMGSVYLALDTQLKRQVALKVPHINAFADRPGILVRFLREAEAAARFQHPNFCPIFDIGEADGIPFLTMAYIDGKTLSSSIERGHGWAPRRAAEVARQLALALAELHRQGIVHRDLKPANIMIDARGGLVLMDFGLARWYDDLDSTFTPTGSILGTPAYMPPEQAEGNLKAIGPRSDLYSLGVILYELLTGRRPFEGPITKVLGMIAIAEPSSPSSHRPDLDPRLEAICLKAMAKKPEDRYVSMDEFAGALAAFLAGEVVPSPVAVVSPEQAEKQATQDFADLVGQELTPLRDRRPPVKPMPEASDDWSSFPRSRPRSPRPNLIVIATAVSAALLFGIIYVATDKGRIKIEVSDPAAVVHVDGQVVRIEGLGDTITLRTGEHSLSVKRGDVEVDTRKFVIRRGDNPVLNVVLEPSPVPPVIAKVDPTPPPKATAEAKKDEVSLVNISKTSEVPKPKVDPTPLPKATVEARKPEPSVETAPPAPSIVDDGLITNSLGMKLKLIPASEFAMGSDASDPDASDAEKVNGQKHKVRITRPFYLGTTEVTVGQFRKFVEKRNYRTEAERDGKGGYGWNEAKGTFEQDPKYTWRSPGFKQEDDHPVVNVSWNDGKALCDWLGQQEGKTYRLPTEAEWEYACRAGRTTRYCSGDDPESLAAVAHFADGKAKKKYPYTAPVGRFQPNAFGLYDMHGNVWEWCADWYESDYYAKSLALDPLNSANAAFQNSRQQMQDACRVFRGGSWGSLPRFCRSACRSRGTQDDRNYSLGFRVARVPSGW